MARESNSPNDTAAGTKSVVRDPSEASLDTAFALEKSIPDATSIFRAYRVEDASKTTSIIVFDTNALLLPYTVGRHSLDDLKAVYDILAEQNRVAVPSRVAREFVRLRDQKMAETISALQNVKSRINNSTAELTPLLKATNEAGGLEVAHGAFKEAKQSYINSIDSLIDSISGWRGDDPVTAIYDKIFTVDRVIQVPSVEGSEVKDLQALKAEWDRRLVLQIPPGYKDAAKDDGGIGDFLIWKSILKIGKERNLDVTFVTGEEKADWYIRASNRPIYPRPELIAEFRSFTGGKNLRLVSLPDLLREMAAPNKLVQEVETAEKVAGISADTPNASILADDYIRRDFMKRFLQSTSSSPNWTVDLPIEGGQVSLYNGGPEFKFYVLPIVGNAVMIIDVGKGQLIQSHGNCVTGTVLPISMQSAGVPEQIMEGDVFTIRSTDGVTLSARLLDMKRFTDGGRLRLAFKQAIYMPGSTVVAP